MITFENGKKLQVELHKKHEKGKCGCPRLTPTKQTAKKGTPKKTEKQKAGGMKQMLDDDHLTQTQETEEKETPK